MSAASSSGGQTASSLPLMLRQHLRAFRMDWTASPVVELGEGDDGSSVGEERRCTVTCRRLADRVVPAVTAASGEELWRAMEDRVRLGLEDDVDILY